MADTISAALQLLLMGDGLHNSDWGSQTNTNLGKVETAISAKLSLTLTGGTYTLSDDEARNASIVVSGILTSNLTLVVPARTKQWIIFNVTTGAFTVSVKTAAGGSNTLPVPNGIGLTYWTDSASIFMIGAPIPTSEVGVIKMFGAASPPINYLICDGSVVSRTTYASLFAIIGTIYGAGDGSTTFNLPDLRGRVPAGLDAGAGRLTAFASTLGNTGGEQNHTLTAAEMPVHNHGVTDPGHAHAITDPGHAHNVGAVSGASFSNTQFSPANDAGATSHFTTSTSTTGISINGATTGVSIQNAGSGAAHNNLQPTIFLYFIIRYA
jgi:microcystin-dependent protein